MRDPLRSLREALGEGDEQTDGLPYARLDPQRGERKGVPEVVLAEPKSAAQTVAIAGRLLEQSGCVVISRIPELTLAALRQSFEPPIISRYYEHARLLVLHQPGYQRPSTGGQVGIITAGTADLTAAEEALALCVEMGCQVQTIYDAGVAGLHRLMRPLSRLLRTQVDALIVAAGMDGALPSVVAGLVDIPVIGLPTSVGYGKGGAGEAALLSMLQTCAPGLAVVNIDNGVGAAAMAALIANRAAEAREHTT